MPAPKSAGRKCPEHDEPKPSVKAHINELYAKAGITDRKL